MIIRKIHSRQDWKNLRKLYQQAFPRQERKPLWVIQRMAKDGVSHIWILEDADTFIGIAITMNKDDLILLDYFAIAPEHRGQSFGTQALTALQNTYCNYRFFLEVERPDLPAENQQDRIRRMAFYRRCGMQLLGIRIQLFGVEMELLGKDCSITFQEYQSVYTHCIGKHAASLVQLSKS